MKKRLAAALVVGAAAQAASAAVITEPFSYSTGALATVSSPKWTATSTGTGDVTVSTGNLQYTDANAGYDSLIGTPSGNLATISNLSGKADRMATTGLPSGSGTLFYSMLLKVTDMTNATTGGGFIAGFNNSTGTATTTVTQAGARLQVRKSLTDATKYNLGIRADISANGTSTLTWDTTDRAVGDTIFLVGEYEFNQTTSADDVAHLWINPAFTDLGAASAPSGDFQSTGGDINSLQIQSFFLRQVSGGALPRTIQVDEIQLGNSWADVTTVPEPASVAMLGLSAIGLLSRRRGKR